MMTGRQLIVNAVFAMVVASLLCVIIATNVQQGWLQYLLSYAVTYGSLRLIVGNKWFTNYSLPGKIRKRRNE
jgi:hypothetical protein